jgi:hypothetical protein
LPNARASVVAEIQEAVISGPTLNPPGSGGGGDFDAAFAQRERTAEAEARQELKELYRLVEIGEEATIACLMKVGGSREIGRDDRERPETPAADQRGEIFVASDARRFAKIIGANAKRPAAVQKGACAPWGSQWL